MQRKQFWYQSIPFDPTLVIAAIEAGAEVIVVAAGDEAAVRRLARFGCCPNTVIFSGGGMSPGWRFTPTVPSPGLWALWPM